MKNKGFVWLLLCGFLTAALLCNSSLHLEAQEKKTPPPKPEAADKPKEEPKKDEPKKEEPKKDDAKKEEPKSDKKETKDDLSETTNSVTINGIEITYRATTGTI